MTNEGFNEKQLKAQQETFEELWKSQSLQECLDNGFSVRTMNRILGFEVLPPWRMF